MTKPGQQHMDSCRTAEPGPCAPTDVSSAGSGTSRRKSHETQSGERFRVGDLCWVLPGSGYCNANWGLVDYEPVHIFAIDTYIRVRPLLAHTQWSETGYSFVLHTPYLKRIPLD